MIYFLLLVLLYQLIMLVKKFWLNGLMLRIVFFVRLVGVLQMVGVGWSVVVNFSVVIDGLESFFLIMLDRCYIVFVLISEGFFGIFSVWQKGCSVVVIVLVIIVCLWRFFVEESNLLVWCWFLVGLLLWGFELVNGLEMI